MRISDWSSDVCSSDLRARLPPRLVLVVDDVARRLVEPFPVRGPAGVDERGGRHREQVEQPERFGETDQRGVLDRSEEHTSELQSLMRISYAVFCLKKKNKKQTTGNYTIDTQTMT